MSAVFSASCEIVKRDNKNSETDLWACYMHRVHWILVRKWHVIRKVTPGLHTV